jgi:hypothetical protein
MPLFLIKIKFMKKYILYTFLAFLAILSGFWIFNHINPWIGIIIVLVSLFLGAEYIYRQIKNIK